MLTRSEAMLTRSEAVLIDVGSSSIKVYIHDEGHLKLIHTKSASLKTGFSEDIGISAENKKLLFDLIKEQKKNHVEAEFHAYGTAIFRKYSIPALKKFQQEFLEKFGFPFTIISQDEENEYLEYALAGKFPTSDNLLLINIGGGSTELVVIKKNQPIERKNVDVGVGTILTEFSRINESISPVFLKEVVQFSLKQLPELDHIVSIAFYTGGELNYMQHAGYALSENHLFKDGDHPSVISIEDFQRRNEEIFSKVTLAELEGLMPDNPKWMHGARACSAFAQAICEKYNIKTIIPSNSNLINGIVRKEFERN